MKQRLKDLWRDIHGNVKWDLVKGVWPYLSGVVGLAWMQVEAVLRGQLPGRLSLIVTVLYFFLIPVAFRFSESLRSTGKWLVYVLLAGAFVAWTTVVPSLRYAEVKEQSYESSGSGKNLERSIPGKEQRVAPSSTVGAAKGLSPSSRMDQQVASTKSPSAKNESSMVPDTDNEAIMAKTAPPGIVIKQDQGGPSEGQQSASDQHKFTCMSYVPQDLFLKGSITEFRISDETVTIPVKFENEGSAKKFLDISRQHRQVCWFGVTKPDEKRGSDTIVRWSGEASAAVGRLPFVSGVAPLGLAGSYICKKVTGPLTVERDYERGPFFVVAEGSRRYVFASREEAKYLVDSAEGRTVCEIGTSFGSIDPSLFTSTGNGRALVFW